MSYSISLVGAGPVSPFQFGSILEAEVNENGQLVAIPSTEASMDITYNYSKFYYQYLDSGLGLRWLYGKKAEETKDRLLGAIAHLGAYPDQDYWADTPGNAGYALFILLCWALRYPDAIWQGD